MRWSPFISTDELEPHTAKSPALLGADGLTPFVRPSPMTSVSDVGSGLVLHLAGPLRYHHSKRDNRQVVNPNRTTAINIFRMGNSLHGKPAHALGIVGTVIRIAHARKLRRGFFIGLPNFSVVAAPYPPASGSFPYASVARKHRCYLERPAPAS